MLPIELDGDAPDPDEEVWKALASNIRRRMLDELREGPLRTGDLADRFAASRHVVMQHLRVLRDADLVRTVPQGRARLNHLNPVPIQRIHRRWVSQYEAPWAEALLGMKSQVESNTASSLPGRSPATTQEGKDVG